MAAETHTDRKSQYHMTVPGELDPKVVSLLELGDGGVQGGKHSKYEKKNYSIAVEERIVGKTSYLQTGHAKGKNGKRKYAGKP